MKKSITILLISLMLLLVGCAVNGQNEKNIQIQEQDVSADKLVVYMNAAPHIFRSLAEEGKDIDTIIYPSRHVIGPMLSAGDVDSPNANVFEKALKQYASEKKIDIEIHYLEEAYSTGEYDTRS